VKRTGPLCGVGVAAVVVDVVVVAVIAGAAPMGVVGPAGGCNGARTTSEWEPRMGEGDRASETAGEVSRWEKLRAPVAAPRSRLRGGFGDLRKVGGLKKVVIRACED
jgi:hypothetical protein